MLTRDAWRSWKNENPPSKGNKENRHKGLFIRGLITEIEGPLAHGGLLAREYGFPAVLGVAEETKRLHSVISKSIVLTDISAN
jgi:phosphoenolpyruvate-protein kinase (PTS system EI component)